MCMRSSESFSLITLLLRVVFFKALTCPAPTLEALESPHTAWRRTLCGVWSLRDSSTWTGRRPQRSTEAWGPCLKNELLPLSWSCKWLRPAALLSSLHLSGAHEGGSRMWTQAAGSIGQWPSWPLWFVPDTHFFRQLFVPPQPRFGCRLIDSRLSLPNFCVTC